ncbi:Heat shock 70 kDa protein [Diplonema papillatum]|nr:Heat shock 70 kDa protein [Diplonema papillatum]
MCNDAEKYAEADRLAKERIEAKNQFENYAHSMKNTATDEKTSGMLSAEDKKTITSACKDAKTKWLDDSQEASKEECECRTKDLEAVCSPIISREYQQAGGSNAGTAGPNVEGVD